MPCCRCQVERRGNCSSAMTPIHTRRRGRLYRYYVCLGASRRGHDTCPVRSIAAAEVEGLVLGQVRRLLVSPELVAQTVTAVRRENGAADAALLEEGEVIDALGALESVWDELYPAEAVIRFTVMMYVRYPLSLRQVEDLLFERGIDICHETVRLWWHRFGPMFAAAIRKRRVHHRSYSSWRWHLDEVFVKCRGSRRRGARGVRHQEPGSPGCP